MEDSQQYTVKALRGQASNPPGQHAGVLVNGCKAASPADCSKAMAQRRNAQKVGGAVLQASRALPPPTKHTNSW